MNNKHTVAYIRQLSCLGLDGEIIMPEILRTLHEFIPGALNLFAWADENYQLSNVYSDSSVPASLQSIYIEEFYNSKKEAAALGAGFSDAMRFNRRWRNTERLGRQFFSSDMFDGLYRPLGIKHGLQATIREKGRSWGSLALYRRPGEKPFTDQDEMKLHSLAPYIAHGLRSSREVKGEMTASGESGTLIFNSQDKLVQFCPEGQRLLLLAIHAVSIKRDVPGLFESPALKQICANLRGILKGEAQPIPVIRQQNAWGEFVFRAYPLSTYGEPDGSIAVLIERHEPLPITLMRNMSSLSMTARQREACLLLSLGHSHNEIARLMHVSKYTATDYVRKIYDKLDVRSHEELMKKLAQRNAKSI